MKISSEIKIGLVGIVALVFVIWGVKYLQGTNILDSKLRYYASYENVNGLEPGTPVLMKGYKVGDVAEIKFYPELSPSFAVAIDIEKKYMIGIGSIAEIFAVDYLGSKAIRIISSGKENYHIANDTLASAVIPDMLSSVMEDISPVLQNVNKLSSTLDSVGINLNAILNDPSTLGTIKDLNKVAVSLKTSLSEDGNITASLDNLSEITANLRNQNEEIAATIANLHSVSNDFNTADIDSILNNFDLISQNLKNITQQIESGEGTMGKLIYNDSLYDHISSLSADLDSLIIDIIDHPEKYVRFSVFGK